MAEGDVVIYNGYKEAALGGEVDFRNGGDTLKVMLVAGYTPDIDGDVGYADVSGDEVADASYDAGGATVANQGISLDSGSDTITLDADDVTWTGLDVGTPSHAILYDDTHASKVLIACWELGRASNGANYVLQFNASGILTLT